MMIIFSDIKMIIISNELLLEKDYNSLVCMFTVAFIIQVE